MYDNKSERGGRPKIGEMVGNGQAARAPAVARAFLSDREHEGFEYVGIFDWCILDPPPPVVTDEWVDLHIG